MAQQTPLVFSICSVAILIGCIISKLQYSNTYVVCMLFCLVGLVEPITIGYTTYVIYRAYGADNSMLAGANVNLLWILILAGMGWIYIINVIGCIWERVYLFQDKMFCKWYHQNAIANQTHQSNTPRQPNPTLIKQASSQSHIASENRSHQIHPRDSCSANKACYFMTVLPSLLLSHKFAMIKYCRMFNLQLFKCSLSSISKFWVYNTCSLLSLLYQIISIYCIVTVLINIPSSYSDKLKITYKLIDALIILSLNLVLEIVIIWKNQHHFEELCPDGIVINKIVQLQPEDYSLTPIKTQTDKTLSSFYQNTANNHQHTANQHNNLSSMVLNDIIQHEEFGLQCQEMQVHYGRSVGYIRKYRNKTKSASHHDTDNESITPIQTNDADSSHNQINTSKDIEVAVKKEKNLKNQVSGKQIEQQSQHVLERADLSEKNCIKQPSIFRIEHSTIMKQKQTQDVSVQIFSILSSESSSNKSIADPQIKIMQIQNNHINRIQSNTNKNHLHQLNITPLESITINEPKSYSQKPEFIEISHSVESSSSKNEFSQLSAQDSIIEIKPANTHLLQLEEQLQEPLAIQSPAIQQKPQNQQIKKPKGEKVIFDVQLEAVQLNSIDQEPQQISEQNKFPKYYFEQENIVKIEALNPAESELQLHNLLTQKRNNKKLEELHKLQMQEEVKSQQTIERIEVGLHPQNIFTNQSLFSQSTLKDNDLNQNIEVIKTKQSEQCLKQYINKLAKSTHKNSVPSQSPQLFDQHLHIQSQKHQITANILDEFFPQEKPAFKYDSKVASNGQIYENLTTISSKHQNKHIFTQPKLKRQTHNSSNLSDEILSSNNSNLLPSGIPYLKTKIIQAREKLNTLKSPSHEKNQQNITNQKSNNKIIHSQPIQKPLLPPKKQAKKPTLNIFETKVDSIHHQKHFQRSNIDAGSIQNIFQRKKQNETNIMTDEFIYEAPPKKPSQSLQTLERKNNPSIKIFTSINRKRERQFSKKDKQRVNSLEKIYLQRLT